MISGYIFELSYQPSIMQLKQDQKELPKELFAVKMYALVTNQPKILNKGKRSRPKNSPRMIHS
jgi:hypothetical protein